MLIYTIFSNGKANGESRARILETSVLTVSTGYHVVWTKDKIDPQELASKRWVERWSIKKITDHFGFGRTFVVRKLGELKKNPELVESGVTRSRIKSRKYRFMGEL